MRSAKPAFDLPKGCGLLFTTQGIFLHAPRYVSSSRVLKLQVITGIPGQPDLKAIPVPVSKDRALSMCLDQIVSELQRYCPSASTSSPILPSLDDSPDAQHVDDISYFGC